MKRVADSQLTKDNGENDDEPQEVGIGFQKADPTALSARKMRSLPKRSLAAAASPAVLPNPTVGSSNATGGESPESTSRFGAFAGFGGSGAVPSAFTFTTPPPKPSNPSSFPSAAPAEFSISSTPTSSAPNPFSTLPTHSNPTPPSTPPLSSEFQQKHNAALNYYMSLRGLNSSFIETATKAVQADPLVDITEIMEKYKSFRLSTQKEFDSRSSASGSGQNATPAAPPPVQASSKPPPSMPVPPKSFLGFGPTPASAGSSTSTAGGGFTPKADPPSTETSSSPFSWSGKNPSNAPATSVNPFALGPSSDKPSSGDFSFTFGKSGSTSTAAFGTPPSGDDNKPDVGPPDSKSTGVSSSFFDKVKPLEKASTPSFSFKSSTPAAPLTPGLSSFMSSSKPSTPTGDVSTPPTKPGISSTSPPSPSAFGFGASKNLGGSSPFGSFGKGSIGNPVGFAFGSPPTTPSVIESSNSPTAFGSKAPDKEAGAESGTGDGSLSAPSNTSHDPSPTPSQGSVYDTGAGEEDEDTTFETRARAYKMSSGEKKSWVSVGLGQLKLKARVNLPKRRILMRNSSTGQVILNFNLFPGFKVTADKKTISFRVPGEDEAAAVYQLRVPTDADASTWQETIQKEVDALVPSDDT